MLANNSKLFACCVLCIVMQFFVNEANAQLQRPTRPEKFSSPEEVLQYVNAVKQHLRLTSPRFGKRTSLILDEEKEDDGDETMNELYDKLREVHQLPTEWQQMKKLQSSRVSAIPLRLLRKYLHLNFDENAAE